VSRSRSPAPTPLPPVLMLLRPGCWLPVLTDCMYGHSALDSESGVSRPPLQRNITAPMPERSGCRSCWFRRTCDSVVISSRRGFPYQAKGWAQGMQSSLVPTPWPGSRVGVTRGDHHVPQPHLRSGAGSGQSPGLTVAYGPLIGSHVRRGGVPPCKGPAYHRR
jgi:hypothetical protein